eukprot:Gb_25886 [translate_table: standard]
MSNESPVEGRSTIGEDYQATLSGPTRNDKTLLMDLGIKLIGGLPEVISFGKHLLGYEIGQGISSPCFSNMQHKQSSNTNSSIPKEGNPICNGQLAWDAKDPAANDNSIHGISRSKSQDLTDKCARNGTCNEVTTTPLPHCFSSLGMVFNGDDTKSISIITENHAPTINGDGLTTGLISIIDQDVLDNVSFPSTDACKSFYTTQPSTEVGALVINTDEGLKDWEGRENLLSNAALESEFLSVQESSFSQDSGRYFQALETNPQPVANNIASDAWSSRHSHSPLEILLL